MQNNVLKNKRFLSIDVGSKLVGYAVYDPESRNFLDEASAPRAQDGALKRCLELVAEYELQLAVIGVPLKEDGTASQQTKDVLQFSHRLSRRSEIELCFIDESKSSIEAGERLRITSRGKEISEVRQKVKKSGALDSLSAVIIAERFLSTEYNEFTLEQVKGLVEELNEEI